MSFDKTKQKEFQARILQNQLLSIGEKFHETALNWLKETKSLYLHGSAESKHPNQLLTELKKLNHERTYIMFKVEALRRDAKLPIPMELRIKLRKAETDIQFQSEFPEEYQEFVSDLKERLRRKPYSPVVKSVKKTRRLNELENWEFNLGAPTKNDQLPEKGKSKKKVPSPCINNIMKMIYAHGTSNLRDCNGFFSAPAFTKAKIERLLGIWMTQPKFTYLKKRLNDKQSKRKHGHAKKSVERRNERRQKYDFINPL